MIASKLLQFVNDLSNTTDECMSIPFFEMK
jgi:hypothetical protein